VCHLYTRSVLGLPKSRVTSGLVRRHLAFHLVQYFRLAVRIASTIVATDVDYRQALPVHPRTRLRMRQDVVTADRTNVSRGKCWRVPDSNFEAVSVLNRDELTRKQRRESVETGSG